MKQQEVQECSPVGCVPPALDHFSLLYWGGGVLVRGEGVGVAGGKNKVSKNMKPWEIADIRFKENSNLINFLLCTRLPILL